LSRDYEPLDLVALATVPFPGVAPGAADWHGLPFAVAGNAVELAPGGNPVALEVGSRVEWVLFAHVLADAPREAAHTLGAVVATYVFELDGANPIEVPIRDRFEIAGSSAPGVDPVIVSWGHLPFAALPIEKDGRRRATPVRSRMRAAGRRIRSTPGARRSSSGRGGTPSQNAR